MENNVCLAEAIKGNARCRLHECVAVNGAHWCQLEISAYNARTDQWKLLFSTACVSRAEGEDIMRRFRDAIRGFSWHDDDFVLEE